MLCWERLAVLLEELALGGNPQFASSARLTEGGIAAASRGAFWFLLIVRTSQDRAKGT